MKNERIITQLRKQIALDVTPIIELIKKYGPGRASKRLGCSHGWLAANVKFDYVGYHRKMFPPIQKVLKRPDHKGIGNTNGLKTYSDENGRECTKCGQYKLWSEYRKAKHGHRGYSPMCKSCTLSYNKKKLCPDFV